LDEGAEGLLNRLTVPKNHPHQTPFAVRKEIIELRNKKKIKLGPKKIQTILLQKYSGDEVPSTTTIYKILRKEGLVRSRRFRMRVPSRSSHLMLSGA
jgi:hypothetical protein